MKQLFGFLFFIACITNVISQVGIGTSSPSVSSILELKSSTKGLLFPRTSSSSRIAMAGVKGLMVYDTTLSQLYYHTGTSWLSVTTGPHPNTHWSVSPDDADNIYKNPDGNVAVGYWQAPYRLSVYGTVYVQDESKTTVRLRGTTATTEARILWELPSNAMDYNITQNLNKLYISRTTGQAGFVSDIVIEPQSGWVGIGTANPETRLNVIGGGDVGNGSGGYLQLGPENDLNVGFDNNEIQGRYMGEVSRLVLNNGGGPVQIGSAVAPSGYSLSVNGKAICEELKIQASSDWPDYVFHKAYSLRSLDELQNFITAHQHLPNIPDADTIEKNGIEVGDMQKRMMEKIEELTLYILQLEEKNKLQDIKIEALIRKQQ
ncbi:MAG TPA: hypothetical protein VFG10_13685 [Saprospiraceae bacterium]|nr:hypothetical protein [Saprospiraceae bacterium]